MFTVVLLTAVFPLIVLSLSLAGFISWETAVQVGAGTGIVWLVEQLKRKVNINPFFTYAATAILAGALSMVVQVLFPEVSPDVVNDAIKNTLIAAGVMHAGAKTFSEYQAKKNGNGKGIGINGSAEH